MGLKSASAPIYTSTYTHKTNDKRENSDSRRSHTHTHTRNTPLSPEDELEQIGNKRPNK